MYQSDFELKEIKLHRAIDGEIQRINASRKPTCKCFASFLVQLELMSDIPKIGLSVGVDVGIKGFLTLSSGQYVPNPRFFVIDEKVLVQAQMKLAKSPKGTVIRAKAPKIVEHINERISNKRENFVQKVSLNLVRTYDLITFEDLNVTEMTKNHCHATHISDVSWRELIAVMIYKAEWAGKRLKLVNPRNTFQMCPGCGRIVKKVIGKDT